MKKNALIDILLNWHGYNNKKKLYKLQELECLMARLQGRKSRQLETKDKNNILSEISADRSAHAFYSRRYKNNIYVFHLEDDSPIDIANNIIHEGFHAFIDDCIMGKSTLKTFSKLNRERFVIEEENLPAIHSEFYKRRMMPLFDSFFIEERLNYQEDSLYFLKLILDSIESMDDAKKLLPFFLFGLDKAADNEIRGAELEKKYEVKYDELVTQILNSSEDFEKVNLSNFKKVKSEIDPEYLKFYESIFEPYFNFAKISKSNLYMPEVKHSLVKTNLDKITKLYFEYVTNKLKSKRKF